MHVNKGGTATLTTSPVTNNTAGQGNGGGIRNEEAEVECIGVHFGGNSAADYGNDVWLQEDSSSSNFTASPCPSGYESTVDGTLDVYGGSGTSYNSYTCTDPTPAPTRKPTPAPTRKPTPAPTAPLLVCSDNSTCTAPCEACCVDYLVDQASCDACVEEECINICWDNSTCNVCDSCCKSYLTDQASCDGCVESEC